MTGTVDYDYAHVTRISCVLLYQKQNGLLAKTELKVSESHESDKNLW